MTDLQPFFPTTQLVFVQRLRELESLMLARALAEAVGQGDIGELDRSFAEMLAPDQLRRIAVFGIRSEVFYPSPILLRRNPRLLGYYRLLYGLSQKEFYRGPYGRFKAMEASGRLTPNADDGLDGLCRALQETAALLIAELPEPTLAMVRDLQLLTLGPQLRGSLLNAIGAAAALVVFKRIREAIGNTPILQETPTGIILMNASGRRVRIEFSSDPDIAIIEEPPTGDRPLLAVEVKGGADVSNVHNRMGEAEKSHLKAKAKGFTEFWTIVNANVDFDKAKGESPTTTRFFSLGGVSDESSREWAEFRDQMAARLGVAASQ